MSQPAPELLIVSGGSEIVGLAVAEAAHAAGIPYAVFSLSPRSMLKGCPGCVAWSDISMHLGDFQALRDHFLRDLANISRPSGAPVAILPTEDGSLRLLNECRDDVLSFGEFPRARALRMGGVDKAEVVGLADREGIFDGVVPSMVLAEPGEAEKALHAFGEDVVFKPSLKPLDMDLSGVGGGSGKVITQRDAAEAPERVLARLCKAWPLSQRWIAQPRLRTGPGLERSVCAVRGQSIRACQVQEKAKYPSLGGTAYWVSMDARNDLLATAARMLSALDVVGVCELSYLPDATGVSQMIELNPRPWLQLGLVEHAGFHIVSDSVAALSGRSLLREQPSVVSADWIQLERALLALVARDSSLSTVASMARASLHKTTLIAGYGTRFPGIRSRLLARMARKMLLR